MIEDEDNLTLEEVISICKNTKDEFIELKSENLSYNKTIEFIYKYKLDVAFIQNQIHQLQENDYHSGPLEDFNPNNKHPLWVFIKNIEIINVIVLVYIKIKIIDHKRKIIVYSFHEEGMHNEKKQIRLL